MMYKKKFFGKKSENRLNLKNSEQKAVQKVRKQQLRCIHPTDSTFL